MLKWRVQSPFAIRRSENNESAVKKVNEDGESNPVVKDKSSDRNLSSCSFHFKNESNQKENTSTSSSECSDYFRNKKLGKNDFSSALDFRDAIGYKQALERQRFIVKNKLKGNDERYNYSNHAHFSKNKEFILVGPHDRNKRRRDKNKTVKKKMKLMKDKFLPCSVFDKIKPNKSVHPHDFVNSQVSRFCSISLSKSLRKKSKSSEAPPVLEPSKLRFDSSVVKTKKGNDIDKDYEEIEYGRFQHLLPRGVVDQDADGDDEDSEELSVKFADSKQQSKSSHSSKNENSKKKFHTINCPVVEITTYQSNSLPRPKKKRPCLIDSPHILFSNNVLNEPVPCHCKSKNHVCSVRPKCKRRQTSLSPGKTICQLQTAKFLAELHQHAIQLALEMPDEDYVDMYNEVS